jgi:5-methyltetrahydrofolate--homocysteine methyltransferase
MDERRDRTLKTAARYLGAKGRGIAGENAEAWERLMETAYEQMLAAAKPRHALRRVALRVERGGERILAMEGLPSIHSNDLCRLFEGCAEGYALLATLGMELDLSIRRLTATNLALAAAVGACGSAYVDVYIDDVLRQEASATGESFTPRFSPGYGDAPLALQPDLLRFLNAGRLGVYLTEGYLMLPEKSVTALFGVTKEKGRRCESRCSACGKRDCEFREE